MHPVIDNALHLVFHIPAVIESWLKNEYCLHRIDTAVNADESLHSPVYFVIDEKRATSLMYVSTEDPIREINVGLPLVQRRRRWTNGKPTLTQRLV